MPRAHHTSVNAHEKRRRARKRLEDSNTFAIYINGTGMADHRAEDQKLVYPVMMKWQSDGLLKDHMLNALVAYILEGQEAMQQLAEAEYARQKAQSWILAEEVYQAIENNIEQFATLLIEPVKRELMKVGVAHFAHNESQAPAQEISPEEDDLFDLLTSS